MTRNLWPFKTHTKFDYKRNNKKCNMIFACSNVSLYLLDLTLKTDEDEVLLFLVY